jgi:hypothetical protein
MVERDEEEWLERALEDKRRAAAVSSPPGGGFADVQQRRAHRHARRRRGAVVVLATALAFVAALGIARWWLWPSSGDSSAPSATAPTAAGPGPATPSPLLQTSGGTVTLVAEGDARVRELGERVFAVDAGTVWFAVQPGSGRMEVRTPDRTIVVLGTVFAVRVDGTAGAARTTVGVLSGRVRVESRGDGVVELAAGEQLLPGAVTAVPLDPAWRARMAEVFPERAAREAPPPLPAAVVVADLSKTTSEAASPGPSSEAPQTAPSAIEPVAIAPPAAPSAGERATGPAASPAVRGGVADATTGQGAVDAGVPAEGVAPAESVPVPGADAGAPSDSWEPPWRVLYQQAWNRLGSDPEGAAAAIEGLIESAPTESMAEDAMIALASIYHDNLSYFARARAVYERYLERFPVGKYRRDAWMGLCLAYGETGDGEKQRRCLQSFAVEFPRGR